MKFKQTLPIILGICLLVSVSALTIHGGETYYEDLTDDIQDLQTFECTLTAQNYDLNGSNFSINETGYILSLDLNFKPDNLQVNCLLNGQKFVSSGGGGGSSRPKQKIYNNYTCSEWSECNELGQRRTCIVIGETKEEVNLLTWRTCKLTQEEPEPECNEDSCEYNPEEPQEPEPQEKEYKIDGYDIFLAVSIISFIILGIIYFYKKQKKL